MGGAVELHERVDLREWTTLKVGGIADQLIRCSSATAVSNVLDLLASHGFRWVVIGAGSRLVPSDDGIRIPIVCLTGELAGWELDLDGFEAGAGARLAQVGRAVTRAGLSGMERPFGTPGSVGGLIHRHTAGDRMLPPGSIEWVEAVQPGRGLIRWEGELDRELEVRLAEHRLVVTRARFSLAADDGGTRVRTGAVGGFHRRGRPASALFRERQPESVNSLLTRAGCGGLAVGRARLAEDQPNLVSPTGAVKSQSILELCRLARDRVEQQCGVRLEPALVFMDDHGREVRP
jgi:UDP-N-acetylmuramate dehydrogenase